MSVDHWVNGFVGCKIDKPYVTVKKRECHHQETDSKFCPDCGKPMWKEEEELSPILEEYEDKEQFGFTLIQFRKEYYIALNPESIDGRGVARINVDSLFLKNGDIKDIFKRILKDLYNPDNFGVWMILDAG